jgi:excinuclease UvrABC ATPase subunit
MTVHPADSHDLIRVRGARENNLKGVDLDLPKRRLTVFTGVSGSGKSSLAFETIAAESQRMINETYSAFVQGFMPQLARPDVDSLDGLTTAIVVDQERLGANIRSTVGTASDANAMLRVLFSRLGDPQIGPPNAYSFNTPSVKASGAILVERTGGAKRERADFTMLGGMCAGCEGTGRVSDLDVTRIYDPSLSLDDGAILVPGYKPGGWMVRQYSESGFFPGDVPVGDFTPEQLHDFLHREETKVKLNGINITYLGLVPRIRQSMLSKDRDAMQPHITGVAGSGKSSLVNAQLAGRDGVVFVDQSAIKGSSRSNPATYTGLLEPIRKAFAKANGVKPALFSSNSEGACPTCKGNGAITTEFGFMQGVTTPCEDCGGRRFMASVLEYTLGGKSIADVLDLPIGEALDFFSTGEARIPAAAKILQRLSDVGLSYVSLGQSLSTLSGGERQRLKLAVQMGEGAEVYVLDEPTTGLHLADVSKMLEMLDRLVDGGTSVIVIEHHQAVMAHADWIIDMGPGAGHDGGRVVFEGTPAQLVADRSTLTGRHLAEYVGA